MCQINKTYPEQAWISLVLRAAFASMFAIAAYSKFAMGLNNYAINTFGMFKATFLPGPVLRAYIQLLPWAEALVVLWLATGIKLRAGWVFTSFLMVSLAFGLLLVQQGTAAAGNFMYMAIACAGLYVSKFDECVIDLNKFKRSST